jgi:hypothetical protein
MILRKLVAGTAGALLLAAVAGIALPGVASAAAVEDVGENVPAQPYLHNPDSLDWLGSYNVNGQQSWCIDFALKAPDTAEQFTTSQTLTTKWGTPVDPTTAAEISYLLLRNGNTTSPDTAAALSYLLHSWTAAPQNLSQLLPSNTFQTIAFDAPAHLASLTKAFPNAATAITTMRADAAANHGPWTTTTTAPSPLLIGTATKWTITVLNTAGKGVANVPVTVTATGATLPNGTATQILSTPADGSALTVEVTPTGPNPKLVATLSSPSPTPVVRVPTDPNTQKVVTTGGITPLTSQATGTALTAPGNLTVTKTDATTKAAIAGALLEVTGADKKTAAVKQDGSALVGTDGKPLALTTAGDGTAQVTGLKTPQTVCVIETTPPPGYDQAFDANSPPTVCGQVTPGATLRLALTNVPNKIPVKIPAGGPPPSITATALVISRPAPAALVGFGGLLVIGAAMASTLFARRASRRRR